MNTEQIVERYLAGDASALVEVIDRFQFAVRGKLYLIRKDRSLEVCDLRDAVAEGVLVGLRRLSNSKTSPLSVIYSCVRSCLRKLERASIENVEFVDNSGMSDEERWLIQIDLAEAFSRLRGRHRIVADLWMQGATERETASLLSVCRCTVQVAREAIVKSIRSSLGHEYLFDLQSA